ncbi:hypothetical protein XENTR_v10000680 [Xenopus tropicalis]|nr:hypothetical protein XENTR_v10000680 [Xenopus tropicalis]
MEMENEKEERVKEKEGREKEKKKGNGMEEHVLKKRQNSKRTMKILYKIKRRRVKILTMRGVGTRKTKKTGMKVRAEGKVEVI